MVRQLVDANQRQIARMHSQVVRQLVDANQWQIAEQLALAASEPEALSSQVKSAQARPSQVEALSSQVKPSQVEASI